MFLVLVLAVALPIDSHALSRYNLTPLGTLGIPFSGASASYAYAINDLGHVAGHSTNVGGLPQALVWKNGVMTGLVDLGFGSSGARYSYAYGINDADIVVGMSSSPQGDQAFRCVTSSTSVMYGLGFLSGGRSSYAYAISDTLNPTIVGSSINATGATQAFQYLPYFMAPVPNVSTPSIATAINNAGNIAGQARYGVSNPQNMGYFVTTSQGTVLMSPFGTPPSGTASSCAYGVNDAPEVVGGASSSTTTNRAFKWGQFTGMMDLGDLPGGSDYSIAYGVNNNHQVVGTSDSAIGQEAFIWESGSGMVSLNAQLDNTGGWTLREARAINSFGLIAAWGTNPQGRNEAVLLTPNGAPAIGFAPASLSFTVNEGTYNSAPQNLFITNTGGGTLNGVIAGGGSSWIQVPMNGGSLGPGQTMTVPVNVFPYGLLPGAYYGQVVITAAGVPNQYAPVMMTVNPYPRNAYSPSSFTFTAVTGGANPPSQSLSISNRRAARSPGPSRTARTG